MPIYEYKGEQYEMATEDRAEAKSRILGYLAKQSAQAAPQQEAPAQQAAPAAKRDLTLGETATGIGASLVKGTGSLIKQPGQLYGLATGAIKDPEFSKTGVQRFGTFLEELGEEKKPAEFKRRQKETQRKAEEAEKTGGQLSGFGTQFSEVMKDPVQLGGFLAETLPSQIPTILAAMVPGAGPALALEVRTLQAAAQAATTVAAKQAAEKALGEAVKKATASAVKRGAATAVGTGAIQQGTDIGAGSYEEIYKYLISKGASPESAAEQAINKARAAGLTGAALSLLVSRLPGAQAMERALAGEKGKLGRVGGAALGIIKESPSEMLEEGGGKVAQNIAMQQVDPTRDAFKGVGATAASAAIGAGVLSGTVGALTSGGSKEQQTEQTQTGTTPPPPPGSTTTQEGTTAETQATEDAAVEQLMETKGYTESQARRIVKSKTAPAAKETTSEIEETAPTAEGTKAGRGKKELPLPTKIPDWPDAALQSTLDFQMGKPEGQRNLPLVQAVQAEIEKRAATQGETQGEANAGQPITTPSGTSTEVAGGANQEPTTTGAGAGQRSAVVSTQSDAINADGREAAQSTPIVGKKGAVIPSPNKGENPIASAGFKTLEEDNNLSENLVGATMITGMDVSSRNQGAGTRLLNAITNWADTNNKTLALVPAAAPDSALGGLTQEQLKAWYARNGFEDRVDYMVRPPKKTENPVDENAVPTEVVEEDNAPQTLEQIAQKISDDQTAKDEEKQKRQRAPGGGRKPDAPEVKAAKAAQPKAANTTTPDRRFSKNKGSLLNQLDAANVPLDEGSFADEESLAQAQEDQRAKKAYVINQLLDIEEANKGTALGLRVKKTLNDRTKISQKEIDKVKKGREVRKKTDLKGELKSSAPLANRKSVGKVDAGFSKATNAAQALTQVIKTGNAFQRFLARRLRPFVAGVKFVVVEQGDPTPERLQSGVNAEAWDRALGVFIQDGKEKIVYVRGASFGNDQGVNNITVLHEMLHAATNQKLELGMLASVRGFSSDAKITRFTEELNSLAKFAQDVYNDAVQKNVQLPANVRDVIEATQTIDEQTGETRLEIFTNPKEFLAYGMSDPDFQAFLNALPGRNENGFSRFVRAILNVLGLGNDNFTALAELINVTDKLLSARKTPTMRLVETGMPSEPSLSAKKPSKEDDKIAAEWNRAKEEFKKSQASTKFKNRTAQEKLIAGLSGKEASALTSVAEARKWIRNKINGPLQRMRRQAFAALPSMDVLGEFANAAARDTPPPIDTVPNAPQGARYGSYTEGKGWKLLDAKGKPILDVNGEAEYVKGTEFNYITDAANMILDMAGAKKALDTNTDNLIKQVKDVFNTDPTMPDKLAAMLYISTNSGYNPSLDNDIRIEEADTMYKDLGPEGQVLYKAVLEHYKDRGDLYLQLLQDNLDNMGIDEDSKSNAAAVLRKMFEGDNRADTYAPLVRDEGPYWLTVGKDEGTNRKEFYIYNDMTTRDADRARIIAERGNVETAVGDSLADLRTSVLESSSLLREMFDAIDSMQVKSGENGVDIGKYKESLKDAIYQSYLDLMPEKSFRQRFKHREGYAGYSTDVVRNIASADSRMNSQLSKLEYAQQLRNIVSSAQDNVRDRRDMQPYATELRERVDAVLIPPADKGFIGRAADAALGAVGAVVFRYFLTGLSAPVLQLISIGTSGMPILYGNYKTGGIDVTMEVIKSVGSNPGYMSRLTGEDAKAMKALRANALYSTTMANDIYEQRTKSVNSFIKQEGKEAQYYAQRAGRAADVVIGGVLNEAEKLSREVIFLAAYRLGRNEQNNLSEAESIAKALSSVREAFGDYSKGNKPLWMQSELGKAAFAFKSFALLMTSQTWGNLYKALPGLNKEGKKEAIKKLSGIMLATSVVAGTQGVPIIGTVVGAFLYGLAAAGLMDDESEDAELRRTNPKQWFRSIWMPNNLPNIEIGGAKLYDIIDRGLVNTMLGFDTASRLQVDDIWIQEDLKVHKTTFDAVKETISKFLFSPQFSLVQKISNAIDANEKGDTQKTLESAMPKVVTDVAKSMRYAEKGVEFQGSQVIEPGNLSTLAIVMQALGFSPDKVTVLQKQLMVANQVKNTIAAKKDLLYDQIEVALSKETAEGDAEAERLMDIGVEEFDAKYPSHAITGKELNAAMLAREKARDKAVAGFKGSKKDMEAVAPLLERMVERAEGK
jgi:hypothetical protein